MFFLMFLISGACGLTYQIVWLRLAAANFGVTTISISILLSIFMAGLSIGSWAAGRYTRAFAAKGSRFFILSYAACEAVIGISGLVVAPLLREGGTLLTGAGSEWASAGFYTLAGAWIALVVLPFTCAMGATLPLALAALGPAPRDSGFARLYLANVFGALIGTAASAFVLIEWIGFSGALGIAAVLNFSVAGLACLYALRSPDARAEGTAAAAAPRVFAGQTFSAGERYAALGLLLASGLSSLGMEVVWTRQFTPLIGSLVYSFAILLMCYLWATAWGASRYRDLVAKLDLEPRSTIAVAAIGAGAAALLPALAADPRLTPILFHADYSISTLAVLVVLTTVGVFSGMTGFLTPMLIDVWSAGSPSRAGAAYGVNTLGCIVGPLLASFALLPTIGEDRSLMLLAAPYFLFGLFYLLSRQRAALPAAARAGLATASVAAVAVGAMASDFVGAYPKAQVQRDFVANTVATGKGMGRKLLVNGIGMTALTPITKTMIHLPAAYRDAPPASTLVFCFGMGTSFKSGLSWGGETTVVELVPGVPKLFGYFHADAEALLSSPKAHVQIDDARRFLRRTREHYDLMVIDPPPPVTAAASSLLYSKEFYALARLRLNEGGILQQWLPEADDATAASVARAIGESFPYVRAFRSVEKWGIHFLASASPIPKLDAETLASRLPPRAARDFVEWGPAATPKAQFQMLLDAEIPLASVVAVAPWAPAMSDDRPVNEYFMLRHAGASASIGAQAKTASP